MTSVWDIGNAAGTLESNDGELSRGDAFMEQHKPLIWVTFKKGDMKEKNANATYCGIQSSTERSDWLAKN